MSLYPTLEDLKVSHMQDAQSNNSATVPVPVPPYTHYPSSAPSFPSSSVSASAVHMPAYDVTGYTFSQQPPLPIGVSGGRGGAGSNINESLYPSVGDYMGLSLQRYTHTPNSTVAQPPSSENERQVVRAPVSSKNMAGIVRAAIKPGVSEVTLCKDGDDRVGLKVRDISKGIFVQYVAEDSAASLGGLRFGDQILSVNEELVAGYTADKVHKLIKNAAPYNIRFAVRDRPFERTVTLTKDSAGMTGFGFQDGRIKTIVKDSSAARNGMVTDHQLVEVNGRNVIGLKDKNITNIMDEGGHVVTVTLMPCEIYEHMIKKIGSLIKSMDHSEPPSC